MAVKWRKRPGKDDLMRGITNWVTSRAGIEHARFDYLHQLTINDLTLMAISMGYKPDAKERENLERSFKWRWERVNKPTQTPPE